VTISEEMSVSMLHSPSSSTVRDTPLDARPRTSDRWARTSAPELSTRYIGAPGHAETLGRRRLR
jgi:hypothetical protein